MFTDQTRPTAHDEWVRIAAAADEVTEKVQQIDYTFPVVAAYNVHGSDYERRMRRAIAPCQAILSKSLYYPRGGAATSSRALRRAAGIAPRRGGGQ